MDPNPPPPSPDLLRRLNHEARQQFVDWPQLQSWLDRQQTSTDEYTLLRMLHVLNVTAAADDRYAATIICARLKDMGRPEKPDLPFAAPHSPTFPPTADALAGFGFQSSDWQQLRRELLDLDQHMLSKFEQILRAGPLSLAQQQALELIEARTEELSGRAGSRMLRGCAALGVEIQDLGSLAVQLTPVTEMAALLPGTIRPVPTLCCGEDDWWQFTSDSRNLEFVLRQTGNRSELVTMFADILPLYTALQSAPPGQYHVGDRIVVLRDPDGGNKPKPKPVVSGSAQLQFNIEMPLDVICDFILDMDVDSGWFAKYFGISHGFWKFENTKLEMQLCQGVIRQIHALPTEKFSNILCAGFTADPEAQRLVKGYLSLLAMCGVHASRFPTSHPVKDMPLLCKTNLGALAVRLASAGIIWNNERARKAMVGLIRAALPTDKKTFDVPRATNVITQCLTDQTHPLTGVTHAGPFPLEVPSPRWTGACPRFQVVLELRRMPILPCTEWLLATGAAFDYFVVDKDRRFV